MLLKARITEGRSNVGTHPRMTDPVQGLMFQEQLRGIKAVLCLQEIENSERDKIDA